MPARSLPTRRSSSSPFQVCQPSRRSYDRTRPLTTFTTGAFTPTCSANHVPRYIEHIADLSKSSSQPLPQTPNPLPPTNLPLPLENKGVDTLLIIAPNDAYVMSGWQKVNTIDTTDPSANTSIIFASDLETKLAAQIGWTAPGDRNGRWAAVIDHGKVTYAEVETELQAVSVSGVEAVLKAL